jgi:hypothetical protein
LLATCDGAGIASRCSSQQHEQDDRREFRHGGDQSGDWRLTAWLISCDHRR